MSSNPTARELAEQLAEERALITVRRDDDRIRRQLDAHYRNALAEVQEQTTALARARRERSRDGEEATDLAQLYRHAARSGARARIRTDIQRSAEMRALRVARVRSAALFAGVPILVAFGLWSTSGVQAGVVRLLGLDGQSAGWWAAWVMEPALLAVVALIIIGRAVLRSSGGDTDWKATVAEWTALSTSVALNMAGGWRGEGWDAVGGALAHSVGPLGAAGTAFLIGLFDSYVATAKPWDGAPRLADLDLTPPAVDPVKAVAPPLTVAGMSEQEQELIDLALAQARTAGPRLRALTATSRSYHWPAPPAIPPAPTRQDDGLEALVVATSEPAAVAGPNPPAPRQPQPAEPATQPATVAASVPATNPPAEPAKRITRRVATKPPLPAGTTRQSNEERVADLLAKHPAMTQEQVAKKLGLGIRTVQRYWPKQTATKGADRG